MKKSWLIFAIGMLCAVPARSDMDGPATLPAGFNTTSGIFDTTFPSVAGYTNSTVCASGCTYTSVATAYSMSSCKTVISIRAGQSFQGNINANKACTAGNWIILQSDGVGLPNQGNRIANIPANVPLSKMATISGANTNNSTTISIASGAAYNWFGPGLEITGAPNGTSFNQGGTILDSNSTASHIIFDRDYIHCAAAQDCTRGWQFLGSYEATVDSVISDYHYAGAQAQALLENSGIGPFKIVNNYLGGASEPFMSGGNGGTPGSCPPVSTPANYEIAGNYAVYDFGSRAATFLGSANAGNIRAPFEVKEGAYMLFQGNVGNAAAVAGQNSIALNYGFIARSVATGCTNMGTHDITYRYNSMLHPTAPISLAGPFDSSSTSYANFSLHDDLADDENTSNGTGADSYPITIDSAGTPLVPDMNFLINHNTLINSNQPNLWSNLVCFTGGAIQGVLTVTNNISFNGTYGMGGFYNDGLVQGTAALSNCGSPAYTWTNNVWIRSMGDSTVTWPTGNFSASAASAVGFANFNAGNGGVYQLISSSPYHDAGTDGLDVGISNFPCLNNMTGAAIAGTYTESVGACASNTSNPIGIPLAPLLTKLFVN